MIAVAKAIKGKLEEFGLRVMQCRSGGGKGIHLFILFQQPQLSRVLRAHLRSIIEGLGLSVGTGGIAWEEVEIFPKQDSVTEGLGNLIALPLARASCALDDDFNCIDREEFAPNELSQFLNEELPERPISLASRSVAPQMAIFEGDEEEIESALKYVDANRYDVWIRIGHILKHTLGDQGLPLWTEWSRTAPSKFKSEDDCRLKWDGFKPRGDAGIGSLFYMAQKGGWNGPTDPEIRKMNARFAILTQGKQTQIIDKESFSYSQGEITFLSKHTFLDRVRSEKIVTPGPTGLPSVAALGPYWLEHKKAEHYYALDFDPSKLPGPSGRTWNLWQGFTVAPAPGDWSLLQHHILKNVCQEDQQKYEWLLNWMALGVQRPGEVIGTAPVLKGMPGTGKGFLANAYGYLWGPHYITVTHQSQVVGRFNAHFEARRFVFIDEGIFGGNRKDSGTIKTRLTEPFVMLERKGVDAVRLRNRMIFMVASNEESIVSADLGERRWMIFNVGDAKREDHQYFHEITKQLEKGGYEAMLYDLQYRDIRKGPNPRRTIKNEDLAEQIVRAQPANVRYLHYILDEGRLPQNEIAGASRTTARALWEELQEMHPDAKYIEQIPLGRFLSEVIPDITRKSSGKYRVSQGAQFVRSTQLNFPQLSLCRKLFEQYIGTPVEWSNDLIDWQADNLPSDNPPI